MVFSCIPFLFFFLPLCLILYYLVPFSWKNGTLLIFSLIFYAWGEPLYIVLMLFSTMLDYTNGRLMERFGTTRCRRILFLCCSVCINLSILASFKYAGLAVSAVNAVCGTAFAVPQIHLPVGISFYTFQTMSYIIDLYRGKVKAERSYITYLTYVSMFPQLVAGPIVRFSDIQQQLHSRKITFGAFEQGLLRFMAGLFKKVLIANQAGALWEEIHILGAADTSVATAWLGALCFTLQLYFDFSAYSDMAIGMGKMLGFSYGENFRYPLTAVSVTDFWRRWHISLSTWFRDYVYIPLGGNRKGIPRHLLNIAVVWFLTGLWHGASWNFVLWGIYYGFLLMLEKYVWGKALGKLPRIFQHACTFLIVVFGFVIFAITDMRELGGYIGLLFSFKAKALMDTRFLWYLGNYGIVLLFACVLACPIYPWICRKTSALSGKKGFVLSAFIGIVVLLLFILSTAYMVSDTYNPFLYFRF
ncbi:MAG: MBOAT family protein [Lachnospiraceae bacterium]|jgi:alginate O-acetyltransferase complex protein AlgI|nr:MBOAT family protein [Lachnospiraceae bacterium]